MPLIIELWLLKCLKMCPNKFLLLLLPLAIIMFLRNLVHPMRLIGEFFKNKLNFYSVNFK